MPIDGFIFDFDGVIVDSEWYWKMIGDDVFFPSIVPGWTRDDGATMMGQGLESGYKHLTENYGLHMDFAEYEKRLFACVGDIYASRAQPLPGIFELIARLQQMTIPLGISSSSKRMWLDVCLKRLQLLNAFSVICTGNDVGERTKPLPDVYLLAAKRMNVDPKNCVALEDSRNGIVSAKAAGMRCIALKTHMNPEQDTSEADVAVNGLSEVTEKLLKKLGTNERRATKNPVRPLPGGQ